jgi:dipeptidyl aminopeptidase/acylaminoacyl peptidase
MKAYLNVVVAILVGWRVNGGIAAELPVETFFRNYQYNEVKISPDGNYLAALAPIKERVGVAVVDLATRKANWAYANRGADVHSFEWISTNRLIVGFTKEIYALGGLIAVNRDGSKISTLIQPLDFRTRFFRALPDSPDEILVTTLANVSKDAVSGLRFPNVARMNVFTGHMKTEVPNPGHVVEWLTDHQNIVRIGVALEEHARFKVLHRAGASATWQSIAEFDYKDDGIWPMGFDHDNKTLFIGSCGDRDTEGLYTFDIEKKQIKDLGFSHAQVDVGKLMFSAGTLVGITYETDRPQTLWLRPREKAIQASVDKALPETLNRVVSTSEDWGKVVLRASADRSPGTFYLLDIATSKMEKLFDLAGWVDPNEMAEMKAIEYQSRDGLTIHGYLTLPKGSSGKNLPLVVNPHGGPALRDVWGFDREVQFLANRGYAVLRMNFRGSTGYGKRFTRLAANNGG